MSSFSSRGYPAGSRRNDVKYDKMWGVIVGVVSGLVLGWALLVSVTPDTGASIHQAGDAKASECRRLRTLCFHASCSTTDITCRCRLVRGHLPDSGMDTGVCMHACMHDQDFSGISADLLSSHLACNSQATCTCHTS